MQPAGEFHIQWKFILEMWPEPEIEQQSAALICAEVIRFISPALSVTLKPENCFLHHQVWFRNVIKTSMTFPRKQSPVCCLIQNTREQSSFFWVDSIQNGLRFRMDLVLRLTHHRHRKSIGNRRSAIMLALSPQWIIYILVDVCFLPGWSRFQLV